MCDPDIISVNCKARIDRCPICNGELQATQELYTVEAILDEDGNVISYGRDSGLGDARIYCENDHTHDEIIEALHQ